MGHKKDHDQDVYRRLELVRRQFQRQAVEQKKQEAAEKRQQKLRWFQRNRKRYLRLAVYFILGALLLAAILVAVLG